MPDIIKNFRPGTCVALYMAVSAADQISIHLQSNSAAEDISITVIANAQTQEELILKCDVQSLHSTLTIGGIKDTAMIILKWRKLQGLPDLELQDGQPLATCNV